MVALHQKRVNKNGGRGRRSGASAVTWKRLWYDFNRGELAEKHHQTGGVPGPECGRDKNRQHQQ
jgi:hypothetical protein